MSIDADTSNLDVALSTRNAEATQLLVKNLLTNIDSSLGQTINTSSGTLTNTLNWNIGSGSFFLMF